MSEVNENTGSKEIKILLPDTEEILNAENNIDNEEMQEELSNNKGVDE